MGKKTFQKRLEHRWNKKQLREELKTRRMLQEMAEEARSFSEFKDGIMSILDGLLKGEGR